MKTKTLAQFKEDKERAINDLQNLQQNLVMIQGVIRYIDSEIAKLQGDKK